MEEDYDPHLHRAAMLKAPINNYETLYHLFKGCLGTGVLALPEAFKMAGMINGIISTFFIGIFCTYMLHVLIRGQYILCKKRQVGLLRYGESMKAACEFGPDAFRNIGNPVSIFADCILVFYQTGTCCVYVVFCGTSIKHIVDLYLSNSLPLYVYMLILFVPFCLILLIRNLKSLAPFSLVADITTILTFIVVFYYVSKDLDDKFSDRDAIGNLLECPLLFGTVLFSLQSVPIVMAIENDMGTPKALRQPFGPLNIAFVSLTIIYIIVAVMGYWRYGDDTESPITRNFPIQDIFAQVIVISYCLVLYVSYALNAYVPLSIVFDLYILKHIGEDVSAKKIDIYDYILRLVFVIVTFIFATCVPFLGLAISLIGSLCLSLLGIIFPAFIEISAYWEEKTTRPGTVCFWKNILLMIIGLFGLFCGTFSSIRGIVEALSGDY